MSWVARSVSGSEQAAGVQYKCRDARGLWDLFAMEARAFTRD